MKHNLKLPDGTIKSVDCKLGTGIKDYYGNEIFEGDRVRVLFAEGGRYVGTVRFEDGSFSIYSPRIDSPDGRYTIKQERCYSVSDCYSDNFKVIGHADD